MRTALLIIMLLAIVANSVAGAAEGPKVLVLGFDGMDPKLVEKFRARGLMPNFDAFLEGGGELTPFGTSTPPQSPVAWSNFITGMDPGGHGIFDFIHRDPKTMLPFFSASEAKGPTRFFHLGKWKIPRGGGDINNLRKGTAFWELLADEGVDATIFKVPSNFPPVECEVRSLSGMGTPDITGNYGISTLITNDPPENRDLAGGRVQSVYLTDGHCTATLAGPRNNFREGDPEAEVVLDIQVDKGNRTAWIKAGDAEVVLQEGEWSGWVTVEFEMIPLMKSVRGICRFYLMETDPALRLYATPVQIDPVEPEMPISTPGSYSREIAEKTGLYYTQGLPDDTNALENDFFSDADYVQQSGLVLQERLDQLAGELDRFAALESGFLFFYFNSPDQTCHTFWRNMDPDSPMHDEHAARHRDRIREVYQRTNLLVLPSRMEGGANVISEAAVAGVPVVASEIPGSIGLLGNDYPGFYPVGDAGSLAKLLRRVETDSGFRDELERRCRSLRRRFSPSAEKAAWANLLQGLQA